jgi:hypothetical protein
MPNTITFTQGDLVSELQQLSDPDGHIGKPIHIEVLRYQY